MKTTAIKPLMAYKLKKVRLHHFSYAISTFSQIFIKFKFAEQNENINLISLEKFDPGSPEAWPEKSKF